MNSEDKKIVNSGILGEFRGEKLYKVKNINFSLIF